jgi:hypothetical protein
MGLKGYRLWTTGQQDGCNPAPPHRVGPGEVVLGDRAFDGGPCCSAVQVAFETLKPAVCSLGRPYIGYAFERLHVWATGQLDSTGIEPHRTSSFMRGPLSMLVSIMLLSWMIVSRAPSRREDAVPHHVVPHPGVELARALHLLRDVVRAAAHDEADVVELLVRDRLVARGTRRPLRVGQEKDARGKRRGRRRGEDAGVDPRPTRILEEVREVAPQGGDPRVRRVEPRTGQASGSRVLVRHSRPHDGGHDDGPGQRHRESRVREKRRLDGAPLRVLVRGLVEVLFVHGRRHRGVVVDAVPDPVPPATKGPSQTNHKPRQHIEAYTPEQHRAAL